MLAIAFLPRLRSIKISRSFACNVAFLALLSVAYNSLATFGLRHLDIPAGTFSQMMTLVIVPFALLLLRRRVLCQTWIGLTLVVVGIFVALAPGVGDINMFGMGLMLASCTIEACYLVRLNDYVKTVDPVSLTVVLLALIAVFSGVAWVATDPLSIPAMQLDASAWASLFMYSIFICGIAMALNIFAQKTASVQDTIIIYAMQIVFSTIFSATLPKLLVQPVPLTTYAVMGCAFVCLGNVVSELDMKSILSRFKSLNEDAPDPLIEGGGVSLHDKGFH